MKKYIYSFILLLLLILFTINAYVIRPHIQSPPLWHNSGLVIAHAMGGINNVDYTNSKDAFMYNYQQGTRIFEVDFLKSYDNKLVLRHSWSDPIQSGIDKKNVPNEATFLSTPIYNKYTPLCLEDLFELMVLYPDIYIITDTKESNEECISNIVEYAKTNQHEDLLNRFIIQIYQAGQEKSIRQYYPFKSIIFTLYKTDFDGSLVSFKNIVDYCASNNIDTITMWDVLWYSPYCYYKDLANIKVYTHTVNDIKTAHGMINDGVDGIYSDFISEYDLYNAD